jgi:dCMP deaminase
MAISTQNRRFLLLCEEVRQGSHDPDRKVGVVVADASGQILAAGTNAPPASLGLTVAESHQAIAQDPDWKYFMLEHAERNAIFAALVQGKSLTGATMYGTLFPCADCARAIVASGLSRLVVFGLGSDPHRDKKWLEHYRHAERILALAGVTVETANAD